MMIRTPLRQLPITEVRHYPVEDRQWWACDRCGHTQNQHNWYCPRCRCSPYICYTCGEKTFKRVDCYRTRSEKIPCPNGCVPQHIQPAPVEEETIFLLETTDVFDLQRQFGGEVKRVGRGRSSFIYEWRTSSARKLRKDCFLLKKDSERFIMLIEPSESVKLIKVPKELHFLLDGR